MDVKTIRCTDCYTEFSDEETKNTSCCPKCSSPSVPMLINQDHVVRINWHELRILTIWASNYAAINLKDDKGARRTIDSIIGRLQRQRKEGWPALTLVGEFTELAESGELGTDAEIDVFGEKIKPKKEYIM